MQQCPEVGRKIVRMYCLVDGALLCGLTPPEASSMIQISDIGQRYRDGRSMFTLLTSMALGDLHVRTANLERIESSLGRSYQRQVMILSQAGEDK
jgi:hypothetical protein